MLKPKCPLAISLCNQNAVLLFCKIKVIKEVFLTGNRKENYNLKI